eukprot:Pgem_evm1s3286
MMFSSVISALVLATIASAKVRFQQAQMDMINQALDQYIKDSGSAPSTDGCAAADAVTLGACDSPSSILGVGEYSLQQMNATLGANGLRKVLLKPGYSVQLYSEENFKGKYLIVDKNKQECFPDELFLNGKIKSMRVTQNFVCEQSSAKAQNDAPAPKQLTYKYNPLFGNKADDVDIILKETMIRVTETEGKTLNTPLMGEGSPVLADAEGSINCVDEAGNDIGFHCLMEPTAIIPKNDQLRKNRNANLCANEQNGDQVHCHASDTSDMYRYVIVDHLNRNYNGNLDCKCGSPAGYVSDCDITTKNDVARYESGDNNCKTGLKDRTGSDRWMIADWGKRFLPKEVLAQQAYYAVELGLDDGKRRRSAAVTEKVEHKRTNGACKRVTTTFNSKVGAKTIMTKT